MQIRASDIHTSQIYNIILDVIYSSSLEFPWNRIGYTAHIWLSNSQVASSGLRCFHCTFPWPMVQFWSKISLLSRIQSGSTRKYPSSYTSFQLITWVASCTDFFNIEIWKTLWTFKFGSIDSWYATCPILDSVSKESQYQGANLE